MIIDMKLIIIKTCSVYVCIVWACTDLTADLLTSAEFKECVEYIFTFSYVFMASCVIENGENYM
jgi:hypothetical protein